MVHPWNVNRVLVVLGAGTALASVALFLFVGGPVGQVAPLVPGIVAGLVLAAYAPAWMYLVGGIGVAAFPVLVIAVFGAYQAIIHPGSGAEGASITLLALGSALSLVGGVAGFVQARRGDAAPPRDLLRVPQGVAAVALAGIVAGLLVSSAWAGADLRRLGESPASLIVADETLELRMVGIEFSPEEVVLPAGKLIDLHVTNEDAVAHTFSYHLGGKLREAIVPAGSDAHVYLRLDAPQTIHYWCAPHSAGADDPGTGMVGTLVVR